MEEAVEPSCKKSRAEARRRHVKEIHLGDDVSSCWKSCCSSSAEPLVFRQAAALWPSTKHWTPQLLAHAAEFDQCDVKALFHPNNMRAASEADCTTETISIQQFAQWIQSAPGSERSGQEDMLSEHIPSKTGEHRFTDDESSPSLGALAKYDVNTSVGYISYQYVGQIFEGRPEIQTAFRWQDLGVPSDVIDLNNSAFWFGTAKATTSCHYDTYGINLAVQVYGVKRWTLFSPADTSNLYPSRLPFEESTVRSQVNIDEPNFLDHPAFADARPYVVELQPGDVLFIPHHWWHHVECLSTCISTNMWLPSSQDTQQLVNEALTQWLVACMSDGDSSWICPTQPQVTRSDAEEQLLAALSANHVPTSRQSLKSIAEALLNPAGDQIWLKATQSAVLDRVAAEICKQRA
eukprot:m.141082 g.141082  ORF g.141082 m.141082 type:complete len:406 (-) comp15971_c0_seq24:2000-3217(-)